MSLAKVIGPDIEELIRENPGQIAAAVKDLTPEQSVIDFADVGLVTTQTVVLPP